LHGAGLAKPGTAPKGVCTCTVKDGEEISRRRASGFPAKLNFQTATQRSHLNAGAHVEVVSPAAAIPERLGDSHYGD